jgi:hypothetical protein
VADDDEYDQIVEVYDGKDCIILELHSGMGWSFKVFLDDEDAEAMVKIVNNKLNARWK